MRLKRAYIITALFMYALLICAGTASAATYSGGSGIEGDPYLLSTDSDIDTLSATSADWDKYFMMTQNITLVGNHTPIAFGMDFTGDFDGNGFAVKNVTIYRTMVNTGFFSSTRNGIIHDLGIETSSDGIVSTVAVVGALVGEHYGTVNNCYATGNVTCSGDDVGVLVGVNYGTISNSHATGNVTGDYYVGGLAGDNVNPGTVSNSFTNCTVIGSVYVGGLVGGNSHTVSNCYATGLTSGTATLGGLIGSNTGTVTNSYAAGNASGNVNIGGLVGSNFGTLTNSFATGDAVHGGLIGSNSGTVTNSYYSGSPNNGIGTSSSYSNFTSFAFVSGTLGLNWNGSGDVITTENDSSFIWRIDDGSSLPYLQDYVPESAPSTFYVGSGSGNSSITAVLANVSSGDTIIVPDGTYIENVDVTVDDIIIRSQNGSASTTIQADSSSDHVFYVTADNVTISGFNITGSSSSSKAGIYLNSADNCTIANNTLTGNVYGIHLSSSSNNLLTNNTAISNSEIGIKLDSSNNYNTLSDNTVSDNPMYGIHLSSSSNNSLIDNTISDNTGGDGIYLESASSNNNLTNNIGNGNGRCIYILESDFNTLTGNNFSESSYGFSMRYANNTVLTNNIANDNSLDGISIVASYNCVLTNNSAINNSNYGIYLTGDNNTFAGNNASYNTKSGMYVRYSDYDTLTNNTVCNNDEYGINIQYMNHSTMSGNIIVGSTYTGYNILSSVNCTFTNEQLYDNGGTEVSSPEQFSLFSSPNNSIDSMILNEGMAELSFTSNASTVGINVINSFDVQATGKDNITKNYKIYAYGTINAEFSYNDTGMNSSTEDEIKLLGLAESSFEWVEVANATLDTGNNTVSANLTYPGYYALFINGTTSGGDDPGDDSSSSTTTTSSSSSSGTRTSVSPGQDPSIVTSTATSVKRIISGSEIDYDFSDSGTPVLGVSFDAKDDGGLVVAKVEILSETPSGVSHHSSKAYQTMSINVGSEGTVSSDNADNIQIRFKVSKEWIEDNGIDISTIRMTRYHDDQWNDLPTYQESEDNKYIYFYAETPGFSIFEVVGDEVSETSELVPASAPVTEEAEEPVAEDETASTPGFTAIAGVVFVSLAFLVNRKQKSE
nr:right-handed parallel beta-helix repeat-containing protein [uncultured Methanolobus sp.]